MNNFSLFGQIDVKALDFHPPIGGMSDSMFSQSRGGWTTSDLKKIGQPSQDGRSGWIAELKGATTSLAELARREDRPVEEVLVSEEIDGKWRTGMSRLSRDALIAELERQGYDHVDDFMLKGLRVDHFVLRS